MTQEMAKFWYPEQLWQTQSATLLISRYQLQYFQPDLFRQSDITWPHQLQRSVLARQAEYLAGRLAVQYLQQQRGGAVFQLPSAADRSPLWPVGQMGSIAHSRDCVFAALLATPLHQAAAQRIIGLDVESAVGAWHGQVADQADDQLASDNWLSATERALGGAAGLSETALQTLAFSAKESLYKALYPQCRRLMDFQAARLTQITQTQFELTLTQDWSAVWRRGTILQGHYFWRQQQLFTLVLPQSSS